MNGQRNGFGIHNCDELFYFGEWKLGKFHGNGTLLNKSGSKKGYKYIGPFNDGKRDGIGIQYLEGKNYYRGSFKNNKKNGIGELFEETLWKYGTWKNGAFFDGIGQSFDLEEKKRFSFKFQNFEEYNKRCLIPSGSPSEEKEIIFGPLTSKKTIHNGYYFRSRLEARWGLFFDFLNLRYLYEPKSFHMPNNTTYTPDFYLPDMNLWIEIKPVYV
jgi:hypothetical protein